MKNNKTHILFALGLILCTTFLPAPLNAEKITFRAEKMSGVAGDKNNSTILKHSAEVITEDVNISADEIELYGDDFRYIRAQGDIKGKNKKSGMEFNCQRLTYDRETKIIVLSDAVTLKDEENGVTAKAEIIDYNQDTEIAVMQIKVELLQKDNVCTSAHAIYKKNDQKLEMSGNPKIVQGSDTFRAQNITLDLDTQEIILSGRVKGSVSINGDNNESADENAEENNTENSDVSEDANIVEEEKSAEEAINSGEMDSDTVKIITKSSKNRTTQVQQEESDTTAEKTESTSKSKKKKSKK